MCQKQFWSHNLNLSRLVELHGTKSLFVGSHFIIADHVGIAPIYDVLRRSIDGGKIRETQKILQEIGIISLSYPPPLLNNAEEFYEEPPNIFKIASSKELKELNVDALFGVFCILAIREERTSKRKRLVFSYSRQIHPIYYLLYAHSYPKIKPPDDIQALLNQCHFTPQQQDFIWRWIRKEISLVAPDDTNKDNNQEQPSAFPQPS